MTEREKEILDLIDQAEEIRLGVGSPAAAYIKVEKRDVIVHLASLALAGNNLCIGFSKSKALTGILFVEAPL